MFPADLLVLRPDVSSGSSWGSGGVGAAAGDWTARGGELEEREPSPTLTSRFLERLLTCGTRPAAGSGGTRVAEALWGPQGRRFLFY